MDTVQKDAYVYLYIPLRAPKWHSSCPGLRPHHEGSLWNHLCPKLSAWCQMDGVLMPQRSECHWKQGCFDFYHIILNDDSITIISFSLAQKWRKKWLILFCNANILAEQTHEVARCVWVDAQRRGDDVSRSVSPVLVIVLGSVQDRMSYCGLCMCHLPCTDRTKRQL